MTDVILPVRLRRSTAALGAGRIRDILETWALRYGGPTPVATPRGSVSTKLRIDPVVVAKLNAAAGELTKRTRTRWTAGSVIQLILSNAIRDGEAAFPR